MTTKEQERKALEQIKKIIAGLGDGSYIATAMDGMIEDAEENIKNDFAMSWKDRANDYRVKLEALAKIHDRDTYEAGRKQELMQKELDETTKQLQERAFMAQQMANRKAEAEDKCEEYRKAFEELNHQNSQMINEIADKEVEIMKLKAKLYDLMTK